MESPLLFPNSGGGYVDFRNFNRRHLLCCKYHGWDVSEPDGISDAAIGFSAPH